MTVGKLLNFSEYLYIYLFLDIAVNKLHLIFDLCSNTKML